MVVTNVAKPDRHNIVMTNNRPQNVSRNQALFSKFPSGDLLKSEIQNEYDALATKNQNSELLRMKQGKIVKQLTTTIQRVNEYKQFQYTKGKQLNPNQCIINQY